MKKVVSIVLCIVLAFSCLGALAAANENITAKSYPTIMVAGYSSSTLYLNTENGPRQIWGLDFEKMFAAGLEYICDIGVALGESAFGHPEKFVGLSQIFKADYLEYLTMNEDGSSKYDIVSYPRTAEETSYAYLYEKYDGAIVTEPEIAATIAESYGENGYEMVYCFQTDFRKNTADCAADLDEHIENVLAYTGADKVNIYAVSHGGETTATYLALYGHKNQVYNVVMTVPAIGGAALAVDVLGANIKFDEEELMRFVENGMMFETDIQWLMKAQKLGFLDSLFNALIEGMIRSVLGYWGSMWDFMPADEYETMKAELLDPEKSAALIEKSDCYHYTILPSFSTAFADCIDNGAHIYIVAGTDNASVTGLQQNSDGIIPVSAATGAKCAPWGSRFPDGYTCSYTNCSDMSHNHLSPAMNIDASTGYLPEQTWYVSGLFHGMTWKDAYSTDLCMKLLFSDELLDVRSDDKYPQFRYSTNTCYSVYAEFDSSTPGYISGDDSVLYVTNLSEKYVLKLMDVTCYGGGISFRIPAVCYIKPGETAALKITGELLPESLVACDITMTYKLLGGVTPYGTRTQAFTIMNGETAEQGGEYVSAARKTPFDGAFSPAFSALLDFFGLTDFVKMFFNFFVALTGRLAFPSC